MDLSIQIRLYNNTSEVINLVTKSKSETSLDHQGLSFKIIKNIISLISIPLVTLINTCMEQGIFPIYLKIAKVILIHKQGDRTAPSNVRPISLLSRYQISSQLSKIFEKILKTLLMEFIDKYN